LSSESPAGRYRVIAAAVFWLDTRLRRLNGVFEYSDDGDCILRISRETAEHRVELADGTRIEPGDPLLGLHIWNEHMPVARAGHWVGWAHVASRRFLHSLRELDAYIDARPEFSNLKAIVADAAIATAAQSEQLVRIAERHGFEAAAPDQLPARKNPLRRLGENILMLLLVMAANPAAARADVLLRRNRRMYLSRDALRRLRRGPVLVHGAASG
jgi:hypothetical protein